MGNYMSRTEINEISEGLIEVYARKYRNKVIQSIDIGHFITEFLSMKIEYVPFAEDDGGRIGFLADGETPLMVYRDGEILPVVFPADTVVLDRSLLAEKEQGRRRFTLAHEAAHYILSRIYAVPDAGRFHTEYDSGQVYTKEEMAQMFSNAEWQADTMGASLLMPRFLVEGALAKFNGSQCIRIYGDTTFSMQEKARIRKMADYLGVSYTALVIRLRELNMLENHDISEYITRELHLGGAVS